MPSKHICIIFTTKSNVVKEKKYIRVNGRNRICSTYIFALSGVTGSSLWLADRLLPVLKHSSGFDGLSCHVWENTERLWCRRLVQRTGGNETWVMSVNGEWSCFFLVVVIVITSVFVLMWENEKDFTVFKLFGRFLANGWPLISSSEGNLFRLRDGVVRLSFLTFRLFFFCFFLSCKSTGATSKGRVCNL